MQTRIRLYQAMKMKSSQALPPDPDSAKQAILRIHYQVYYWLRYALKTVPAISFADNAWKLDENGVIPTWFTGCSFHEKILSIISNNNQFVS